MQINALISARKPYDLLLFPDERHSPRRPQDRVYMEQRIAAFLLQHLVRQCDLRALWGANSGLS